MEKKEKLTVQNPKPKSTGCDPVLFWAVTILLMTGLVMVFSASGVFAMEKYDDPYYFLKRQSLWLVFGMVVMMVAQNMDYKVLEKFTYPILLLTFVLLILVILPGIGQVFGGARRWLVLGPIRFQPSELAKFTLILFIAKSLVKRADQLKNFTFGYLPNLIVLGVFFFLILFQPDLGTPVLIGAVVFTMLYVGGVKTRFLTYSALAIIPFLGYAIYSSGYRLRRIEAFFDPTKDPTDSGFQAIQSFYAFGRGGYWGTGLGDSNQKLFFLPEAHTDFIFSVIGEELGFAGAAVTVILFAILVWRGFLIALSVKDSFGTHLAVGLTLLMGLQAFTNMGVAVGLLPTKGLPLPFISLGGSSLLVCMLSMGVLLNISKHAAQQR